VWIGLQRRNGLPVSLDMRRSLAVLVGGALLAIAGPALAAPGTPAPSSSPSPAPTAAPDDALAKQLQEALAQRAALEATKQALAAEIQVAHDQKSNLLALITANQKTIDETMVGLARQEGIYRDAGGRGGRGPPPPPPTATGPRPAFTPTLRCSPSPCIS
jgi:hypothetical protein